MTRTHREHWQGSSRSFDIGARARRLQETLRIDRLSDLTFSMLNNSELFLRTFDAMRSTSASGDSPGIDGICLSAYSRRDMANGLTLMQSAFADGTYLARPLRRVRIPKPDGRFRELNLPVVLERVVAKTISDVLLHPLDAYLPDELHGYRPGRSVLTLLQSLCQIIESKGFRYLLSVDIRDAFPSTSREVVDAAMPEFFHQGEGLRIKQRMLFALAFPESSAIGLPQGLAFSPLLFNLAMSHHLPWHQLRREDMLASLVYADNIVLVGASPEEINLGCENLVAALRNSRMQLKAGPETTDLTNGVGVNLFNHTLKIANGRPRLEIAEEAWRDLERKIESCILSPNPYKRMGEKISGWREHFALGIDSDRAESERRIREYYHKYSNH